jgi:S-DNA-T family DNA segregation ATPase FtsK/SpoIIIE
MRREVIGILLFFLVVFILVSLVSYSPSDPSIHNARETGAIRNLFGLSGAHLSGILVGLFGLGAFWIPVLLLFACFRFLGNHSEKAVVLTILGGILLLIATGSLLSFKQNHYLLFGSKFSAGGVIGFPLKSFLVRYTNTTGAAVILFLMWIIGLILATKISIFRIAGWSGNIAFSFGELVKIRLIRRRERKVKSKKHPKPEKESGVVIQREEPKVKAPVPKHLREVPAPKQEVFEFMRENDGFRLPPISFLEDPDEKPSTVDHTNLMMQSKLLEKKLEDFGVNGKVVTVSPGPVITTFEYEPAPGVKINKIVNLSDDLALALRATSVRIVAPIPGKAVIGIEIPNAVRQMVRFKEVVVSSSFEKSKSKLTLCLGKDIVGNPVSAELDKMPHLLIAGATGTGKSVALNSMICSLLFKAGPEDVKLIMIDPKRIELSSYDGIPQLITPVVTDVKKATNALFWAVREMERRYKLLSEKKARNITQYNQKIEKEKSEASETEGEKLPYIVIIIDELADLMMVASRDVEVSLMRLAQMARAAGIHLILATQRPSVDVLTGIIKANFPTRLTFQVSSKTDSRTIIDANGAESLLGSGDMLFLPPGTAKLQRIHGAYISETELTKIIDFLKSQKPPEYDEGITEAPSDDADDAEKGEHDERYDDAVALVTRTRQASISMVQRHLRIGYNRAARIIEVMEKEGIVGPSDGVKPREVLVAGYDNMP